MSTNTSDALASQAAVTSPDSADKGKGKAAEANDDAAMDYQDDGMDDDDDDDDDDEDGDDDDDDEDEEDDTMGEIEPEAILPRRTRGLKVDYTSAEALGKAGLKPEDADDDD